MWFFLILSFAKNPTPRVFSSGYVAQKWVAAACKKCGESALGPLASTYICSLAMIVVKQNKGNPERMIDEPGVQGGSQALIQ
jgi:hypothetical protein